LAPLYSNSVCPLAANRLAANALVPLISAAIVIFALSAATSNVYTGSRILYGLALDHQAPAVLRKVTAAGRPLLALVASTAWCFLSYVGTNEASLGTFLTMVAKRSFSVLICRCCSIRFPR
jgi:yeast amino acid transporter